MSPRARRLAAELGVDTSALTSSRPDGRIVEADIRAAFERREAGEAERVAPGRAARLPNDEKEPNRADPLAGLTGPRAVIAREMTASHHDTAAVTLTYEARADGVREAIAQLRETQPEQADALSVDLLFAALAGRILRRHPQLNASLTPAGIVNHPTANVGIAIDSPRGLVVPVLRAAHIRPIGELAAEWAALRARALAASATRADMSDGTFTVTNLGPWGIDGFTPIINRSECAILGIGRIRQQPVVDGESIVAAPKVVLSLTFDHRIVDGAPAARFLSELGPLLGRASAIVEALA